NRIAVSNLEVGPEDTVLEIGFGSGAAIQLLREHSDARRICGIDPSDIMAEEATARNEAAIAAGRVQLLKGTVLKLPFRNEEFSRVFAVSTFHDWKDRAAGLREIRRVLRDDGYLLLCLRWAPHICLPWSLPGITESELAEDRRLITACGFRNVHTLGLHRKVCCLIATAN